MSAESPSIWCVTDGKAGDRVQCEGVAVALGGETTMITVSGGAISSLLAPWGPASAADLEKLRGPFPDFLIASGRRAIPFARAAKRASGGRSFLVILKDPRGGRSDADLIWAPQHDRLEAPNVFSTLTSPHGLGRVLSETGTASHADIARLPRPFLGLVLGGPGGGARYGPREADQLAEMVLRAADTYAALAVTPSRRTPEAFSAQLKGRLSGPNVFFWEGEIDNPYKDIIANAETLIVAADSHNMMSEACATSAGVYAWRPPGMAAKLGKFVDELEALGRIRPFGGAAPPFEVHPIDATTEIATEIRRRRNS